MEGWMVSTNIFRVMQAKGLQGGKEERKKGMMERWNEQGIE
jgi:hypothetical protein